MLAKPKVEKQEDFLMNYGKQVKEKIEQKRSEMLHQELENCKFKPTISRKSDQIVRAKVHGVYPNLSQKPPTVNKFSNLYEDAQRRKER